MSSLHLSQKVLLGILSFLILLMLVFSFNAMQNTGMKGYTACMEEKCLTHGEAFCSKFREVNNCCLGAGGKIGIQNNKPECFFD